jgi:DNA replication factor Dna2
MDPSVPWVPEPASLGRHDDAAKRLLSIVQPTKENVLNHSFDEDEDATRTSGDHNESMTQDCIEWDESKHNVDLRKLADPTFQTPNLGDETPVHSATHNRPRRQSLEAVTRYLQSADDDKDSSTVQEIDDIFHQLSNSSGEDGDSLTPRQSNSNAMLQKRPTSSSSNASGVFAVAGSRKRHRREQQKQVNIRKPLAPISEQHQEQQPLMNAERTSIPTVDGSTDFDDLLQQIETPPVRKDPSTNAPATTILQAESRPLVIHNTNHMRPAPMKQSQAPTIRQPIQNTGTYNQNYQPPSANVGQHALASSQPNYVAPHPSARPTSNAYATQTVPPMQQPRPIPTMQPAVTKSTATTAVSATTNDADDEFGDMDFSLDDFAEMDSLVIAATQQHASQSQSSNDGLQQQQQYKAPTIQQLGQLQLETKAPAAIASNPVPSQAFSTHKEDDPFGDIPDIDIEALVRANQGEVPSSLAVPVPPIPSAKPSVLEHHKTAPTPGPKSEAPAPRSGNKEDNEDQFDDLPDFDLDALVKQAELTRAEMDGRPPAVTPILPNGPALQTSVTEDDEFPDIDFDALDKAVAERTVPSQTYSPQTAVPPPNAVVRNPRRFAPTSSDDRSFLTFSRYKVIRVDEDVSTFTKTLTLACWTSDMLQEEEKASQFIHHHSERRMHDPNRVWPTAGVAHLRGEWYHTRLSDGDTIHIVSLTGQFRTDVLPLILHTCPPHGSDSDDLVVIVHPDLLLTPTAISETVSCTRRAILKNRLGSTGLTCK